MKKKKGKVYLIGAGPGDPGLITLKGKECIEFADVVIYDYLAAPELLRFATDTAEIIYVGKKGGDHTLAQEKINSLIAEKAEAGLTVARLKGGDPFIFGRGGEEAEVLIARGIPFEIVPGVTSAIAAPAYAGIPLTHRKFTSSVAFITGHEDPTKDESTLNWDAIAKGLGTIVFLMGVKNLPHIVQELIRHGKPAHTPIALVRWGTTPRQQTVAGTLENIVERVNAAGLKSPSIIVVGEVVTLRESMKWFETRPLMGKTIVVTRARHQASDLVKRLSDLGAQCIECPTIAVVPEKDLTPLDHALNALPSYTWLIFTSVNGVEFFFKRLFASGKDVRSLGHLRTASIGPATAQRLFDFGLKSDIIPENFMAESIIDAFRKEAISGKKILLPRALEARPLLPVELTKMGAIVDEVIIYHTEPVAESATPLVSALENREVDLVTFTSSSTARNFHALLPPEKIDDLLKGVTLASIGPITSDTAKNLGFNITVTAEEFTIEGLCDAVLKYFSRKAS